MENLKIKKISFVTLMLGLTAAQSNNLGISTTFAQFPKMPQLPTTTSYPTFNEEIKEGLTSGLN